MTTPNAFDFVNAINYTKVDLISTAESPVDTEKAYVPFLTNRQLSYSVDCVLLANEMNKYASIDNKLQFDFLINSIRPRKRFSKWVKKSNDEDVKLVMQHYNISERKAQVALQLLTSTQLEEIRKRTKTGSE